MDKSLGHRFDIGQLQADWASHLQALGIGDPGGRVCAEVLAGWQSAGRAYHTLEHLAECLGHLRVWGEGVPERHEVGLALWFHDLVYDPQAKDNEDRSIEAAKRVLGALGLDADRIARVARLVEITKHGAVESTDATERLMVDIDLSILGAPPARFASYCEQVAIEYGWVPAELYQVKRREFIEVMLARPQLFLTPIAHQDLEVQARAILEQERRRLA